MTSRADPKTEFFPGANPHPVMRVSADGDLIYANPASGPLLEELGLRVGQPVPPPWLERIQSATGPIDARVGPRTFELLAVRLADLGFINVYGTDVTAEKVVAKFPGQNPNPVLRTSTAGGLLIYANPASSPAHRPRVEGLVMGEPHREGWADDVLGRLSDVESREADRG